MDVADEQKVLASLYDRLFDAITYSPDGKSAPFNKGTSFMQMAKNVVLNPDDFANMMNPGNPGGEYTKAELFSALVDEIPSPEPLWSASGKKVSETYSLIVNGANTASTIDPAQQKIYDQAYAFLNTSTKIKDFTGNEVESTDPSQIAATYDNNFAAYITAVGGYRAAYNGYDLTKISDQRAWNAVQPGLQLAVDQAWNKFNSQGRAQVDQARAALSSTINDAIRNAIEQAQKLVNDAHKMAPNTPSGSPWLPSYALPTNWFAPSSQASKLHFASSYINSTASSQASSYASSASGNWGLWHASGGVSGSSESSSAHMDASDFSLDAELIFVQIKRPWYNPLLFTMKDWSIKGYSSSGISNGGVGGSFQGAFPLVPTGFVLARNVKISANFSEQDKSFVAKSISTRASGGWGPFSVSGSYSSSSSKSTFEAKFNGGTLELPGLQLVAWVNAITPASPPNDS
jgi:hypothetical protein